MSAHRLLAVFGNDSNARLAGFYWATVGGIIAFLWAAPAIPTQDGPSHLYNLALIMDLLGDEPARGGLHELDFESLTNLGFIATALPLAAFLPLWAVERVLLSAHILLLAIFAVTWLAQTARRTYPTAWVALAFSLPWSLFMGFYSYQLGADLALLALCFAWKQRDRALPTMAPACWAAAALVLFFHAVAAGLLAGLLALLQLTRRDAPFAASLLRAAVVSLPVLVMVFVTIHGGRGDIELQWRSADYILLLLATFGTLTFSTQLSTCLLVSLGFALLCLPGTQARQWDRAARFAVAGGASLALLHLCLPDFAGGGGYLTGRFAWWIPLLMLPVLDTGPALGGRVERNWVPPALVAIAVGSTIFSAAPSARLVAEVKEAARTHAVSGTLATAIFDRAPKSDAMIEPLRHVAASFALDDGIVMTNYQAWAPFFPVRFTPEAQARFPNVDINAAWLTDWARLPISALVTIDAQPADRHALGANFEPIWISQQERVELWHKR